MAVDREKLESLRQCLQEGTDVAVILQTLNTLLESTSSKAGIQEIASFLDAATAVRVGELEWWRGANAHVRRHRQDILGPPAGRGVQAAALPGAGSPARGGGGAEAVSWRHQ